MNEPAFLSELTTAIPVPRNPGDVGVSALTAGMVAGREEAWTRFHAEYFDRLLRYLFVVCRGDEDAAKEALQTAFVKISRTVKRFDDEAHWWAWLTAIARSCVIDGSRKRSRYLAALERYTRWFVRPAAAPDRAVSLSALLDECLCELDVADRELLRSKYEFGEAVHALAEEAGCSVKAMESRLGRLRRLVKERLLNRLRHED